MPLKHKVLIVCLAGLGWVIGWAGPLSLFGVPLLFGVAVWLGVRRYFVVLAIVLLTSPMAVSASLATLDYARGDAGAELRAWPEAAFPIVSPTPRG